MYHVYKRLEINLSARHIKTHCIEYLCHRHLPFYIEKLQHCQISLNIILFLFSIFHFSYSRSNEIMAYILGLLQFYCTWTT